MVQHSSIDHTGITGVGGAIDWGETGDITDQDYDDVADAGVLNEAARADHLHGMPSAGTFDPDAHLPWHVWVVPMITTPDAVTGTWALGSTPTAVTFPFIKAASGVEASRIENSSAAQNDAWAVDVILAAGTWDCHVHVRRSSNTGIITLQQAGADQGTADTYAASADYAKVSVTGFTVASTGKKRMNLKMATKNASSSGYVLGFFAVEFRRTA